MWRSFFAFIAAVLIVPFCLTGQCTIDSSYTESGVFPARLAEACVDEAYLQEIQVVVPFDTNYFGFQVIVDSFQLESVTNLPDGLEWNCYAEASGCRHVAVPPALIRTCLTLSGTPTTLSGPADSIEINSRLWVTVPFVGVFSLENTVKRRLRVNPTGECVSAGAEISSNPGASLLLSPQPLSSESRFFITLQRARRVSLQLYGPDGRRRRDLFAGWLPAGQHALPAPWELPPGIYFAVLRTEAPRERQVVKVLVTR